MTPATDGDGGDLVQMRWCFSSATTTLVEIDKVGQVLRLRKAVRARVST